MRARQRAYEISAYQSLIIAVSGMQSPDAVALLQDNLNQETHTSEELYASLRRIG